jgi:hypothetical protein
MGLLETWQSYKLSIKLPEILLMQKLCVDATTVVGAPYWEGGVPFSLMIQKGMKMDFMLVLSVTYSSFSLACNKKPLLFLYSLGMTSAPKQQIRD